MQLTKGYKQTEVGVIPEDWEVRNLGEIVTYTNGKAHEKEITDTGDYIVVNSKFISTDGAVRKYSNSCLLAASEGDVLMVMSDVPHGRAIARCRLVTPNDKYTINQRICRLRPTEVDGKLLCYKLNRNTYYLAFDDGVKQTNLRKNDVLSCPIPLPPTKAEQEAIAEALSDTDAWIESLEQLIAKKRRIKAGSMQALLTGKQRLPGFSKEWANTKLRDLASLINGRAYSLFEWESSGTPVIRLQNLTGRGDKFYYSNLTLPERQYCKNGDLLFMWSATFGPIIWNGPKAIYHYHIWKIECRPRQLDQQFLFHYLSDITEKLKISSSSGGTMLHLTKSGMEEMEISVPDFPEQTAIATILSDMDTELDALEAQLSKARQIKQGMMQELLTGKTRLV